MKKGRKKVWGTADEEIAAEIGVEAASKDGYKSPLKKKLRTVFGIAVQTVLQYKYLLIRTLLPTVYALLFGSTGFEMGIYPFGISAVCAVPSGASAFLTAAGAAVSSLFVRGGFYIMATCLAGAGILAVIRKIKGSAEGAVLRATLSMLMGAAQTVAYTAADGISFYDLSGILLSAAICPVLAVALRGLILSESKGNVGTECGVYILLYTCVYALRGLSYTGASAATVISMTAVLYASYAFGIHRGIMTGVAVGLASDPAYSVIYAAAAAGSGVLMSISPIGAVSAGVLIALSFGIHSAGASAFGDLFPEFMFCAAIAGPVLHYGILPMAEDPPMNTADTMADINEKRLSRTRDRLHALSDSLGAVSTVMRRMSKVFSRPSYSEIRQMCDDAFDESCQLCEGRGTCWDKEYRTTASAVNRMAADLRHGKVLGHSSLPEGIRGRCPYSDAIISRINLGAASSVRTAVTADKTASAAEDYAAMSRLIDEVTSEGDSELELDRDGTDELSDRLYEMGLRTASVAVYGDRRRIIWVRGLEHGCTVTGEEIQAAAKSVLGGAFTVPEYRISGREVSLEMHTAERFTARSGRSSVAKRGEQCGDSVTSFKGSGGYFYTLISDGMGSGGEAAITSGASSIFLERMLSAGCSLTIAAEMLNSFLTRRNSECFATVDLMEADLITGELRFLKSGAAPSFILREGKLFRLASKTVPVGIVTPFDAEILSFTAKAGDHVIMLSDGVVPDGGECPWLCDMLTSAKPYLTKSSDLKEAADGIAKMAAERSGYGDDVTVGIVRIDAV